MRSVASAPPVLVLVCGSPDRGDDGAVIAAADRLPAEARALAVVRVCGGLDVTDLLEMAPDQAVVIVDAAVGVAPGEIVVLPLEGLGRGGPSPASSHALPIDQVLGVAAALRGRLPEGAFVGIGGSSFAPGAPLSPAVREGLASLMNAVAAEVGRLARGRRGGGPGRTARRNGSHVPPRERLPAAR